MQLVQEVTRPPLVFGDEMRRCVSRRGGMRDGARGRSGAVPRGSSFDPSKLANVARWFEPFATDITIATGVSQWNDRVGAAPLLQATGASQPAYNAADAAYGGRPTVQSTGAGQRMLAAGIATAQPLTIWLVGDCQTDNTVLCTLGSSAATPPRIFRMTGNVLNAGAGVNISSGVAFGTKRAVMFTANGASSFLAVDNWLTGGIPANGGTVNGTDISAFAFSGGDFGCTGKIALLVIQLGVPTAAEKASMASYVSKFGITVT